MYAKIWGSWVVNKYLLKNIKLSDNMLENLILISSLTHLIKFAKVDCKHIARLFYLLGEEGCKYWFSLKVKQGIGGSIEKPTNHVLGENTEN